MNSRGLRIYVSEKYFNIYTSLTKKTSIRESILSGHGRVFTFVAILGFLNNRKKDFINNKKKELVFLHSLDEREITILQSIALLNNGGNNLNIISNNQMEKIIKINEKYANGGMKLLVEGLFSEYIKQVDGNLLLEYEDESYLGKEILDYINEKRNIMNI